MRAEFSMRRCVQKPSGGGGLRTHTHKRGRSFAVEMKKTQYAARCLRAHGPHTAQIAYSPKDVTAAGHWGAGCLEAKATKEIITSTTSTSS